MNITVYLGAFEGKDVQEWKFPKQRQNRYGY